MSDGGEDNSAGSASELAELQEYREKVVGLLRMRETKCLDLEQEKSRLLTVLEDSPVQKLVRMGDAKRIIERDMLRRTYGEQLEMVERSLAEAKQEFQNARERLSSVDEDLRMLCTSGEVERL